MSSGFAEQGGNSIAIQQRMSVLACQTGMRVCGPNSVGFFNVGERIAATFSPAVGRAQRGARTPPTSRPVGVISQSGGVGFTSFDYGTARPVVQHHDQHGQRGGRHR